VLVFVSIPALSLLFLQNRKVQTIISQFAADKLSEELGTTISISSVSYSFFNRVQLKDLYIEDQQGDTLLYSEITRIRLKTVNPKKSGIEIRKILLDNAHIYFASDSTGHLNLEFITDRIKNTGNGEGKGFFSIKEIEASNSEFRLRFAIRKPSEYGIDFTNLIIKPVNVIVNDLFIISDTVSMKIKKLSGIEQSGFQLMDFNSDLLLSNHEMTFSHAEMTASESKLECPLIAFKFNDWQDFQQVYDSVKVNFIADYSELTMRDLAYFVPIFNGFAQPFSIEGEMSGKLSDLRSKRLKLSFNHNSKVDLSMVMIGLPDIPNTLMHINFSQLSTNITDLNQIFLSAGLHPLSFPETISEKRTISYRGKFTGYTDDFVAFGELDTEFGAMKLDISLKPDTGNSIKYRGRLGTSDFALGRILDKEDVVGALAMNVLVDGSIVDGTPTAEMDGEIASLLLNNYRYSNILIKGALSNDLFDGFFTVKDPNIQMDFTGKVDFTSEIPVFNFTADVSRARPYFLNLNEKDPNLFVSFLLKTNFSGEDIDQLNGNIHLINSFFRSADKQLQVYDLTLEAINNEDHNVFHLRSDLLDADMNGRFRLSTLPGSVKSIINKYVAVFPDSSIVRDSTTWFDFSVALKNTDPFFDFFLPDYQVSTNSVLAGHYDFSQDQLSTTADIPYVALGKNKLSNLSLVSESDSSSFHLTSKLSNVELTGGMKFSSPEINFYARDGSTWLDLNWNNRDSVRNSGEIRAAGKPVQSVSGTQKAFAIDIYPSRLFFDDTLWNLSRSQIILDSSYFSVDSLIISGKEQFLMADGTISGKGENKLDLSFKKLNLGQIRSFVKTLSFSINGICDGNVEIRNERGKPVIISDLTVTDMAVNETLIGTTRLNAKWINEQDKLALTIDSKDGTASILDIEGDYYPKDDILDFDLNANKIGISILSPYFTAFAEELKGTADIVASLDGSLEKPEFNGTVKFNNGSMKIGYLQTVYSFSDKLRIYKNNLFFENFKIEDKNHNIAMLNGNITNNLLQDIRLNLNFQANNFNFMNTTSLDNDTFYGTVFGSGNIKFTGPLEMIRIDINAQSDKNTYFYLPLYTASEVHQNDFITFISTGEDSIESQATEKESVGILMNIELTVTPEATVQLIFDQKVGDIIEASGKGKLLMSYDEKGDFRMFGEVGIDKGNYLFTLQNVINKRFEVKPDGSISWNGAPEDANIDIQAVYDLRVSPYNLSPDPEALDESEIQNLKKRIPVECVISLRGDLMKPSITPTINMPTADAETRDLLVNSTLNEEDLMKQFVSLMVLNSFFNVSGGKGYNGFASPIAGAVTASELFSNQISNWMSQASSAFDLGINYRPKQDEYTPGEIELALTVPLLNDRVIVSGDVDYATEPTNPVASNIVGNVNVEVKLTNNISFKAFNRANDYLSVPIAPYTQGIGVFYREEFNTFADLKEQYKAILSTDKKKKKKAGQENPEADPENTPDE